MTHPDPWTVIIGLEVDPLGERFRSGRCGCGFIESSHELTLWGAQETAGSELGGPRVKKFEYPWSKLWKKKDAFVVLFRDLTTCKRTPPYFSADNVTLLNLGSAALMADFRYHGTERKSASRFALLAVLPSERESFFLIFRAVKHAVNLRYLIQSP